MRKIVKELLPRVVDFLCEEIKDYVKDYSKSGGVVLGMSGGVDCSTVAALCARAGVPCHMIYMPAGDYAQPYNDCLEVANKFNLKMDKCNINYLCEEVYNNCKLTSNIFDNDDYKMAKANISPRIRMTFLYTIAQMEGSLVIGTSNASELYTGYFTKWGDGAADFEPLANLSKSEVYAIAKYLGVPDVILNKEPSADLWEGQTDEEEMGFSYDAIEICMFQNRYELVDIDTNINTYTLSAIIRQHRATEHKRKMPPFLEFL